MLEWLLTKRVQMKETYKMDLLALRNVSILTHTYTKRVQKAVTFECEEY